MKLIVTTTRNFLRHRDTDLAAGLTYYSVLAVFPAMLALLALLGVLGEARAYQTIVDLLKPLVSAHTLGDIEPTLHTLTRAGGASWALAAGVAGALYSASAYVGAFSRAMNTVREVEETRPFWKLRPLMLLITLVAVLLNAVALAIVALSGPVASSVGAELGVRRSVLDVWAIAKWPGLALVVIVVVALLYHATPNVRTGRVRLLSLGALLALFLGVAVSVGFAFYVANFSSYNKTYGSVAGVIVALLWLWLINLALLYGAELDSERDRRRAARREAVLGEPGAEAPAVELVGAAATESFPQRSGRPVYGPMPQPVPEED